MAARQDHALSDVLDRLEASVHDGDISVREIMDHLGDRSFAALILVPALISASPASAIPGLTTAVALIVVVVTAQMLLGREHAWLPGFLSRRRIAGDRLCRAVRWLRRPVASVERLLRPRLGLLVRPPGLFVSLLVILLVAVGMPFLEIIPTAGSVASLAIALFAAGLLTRDGLLVLIGLVFVAGTAALAMRFGLS